MEKAKMTNKNRLNNYHPIGQQTVSESDLKTVVMWTKYTDATKHKELVSGKKYCVKGDDDIDECYARFVVYDGGNECDFICLHTGRGLNVSSFRELDRKLDT